MPAKDLIICGNNAQILAGFPDNYFDLTVTSPPYDNLRDYNGYEWDFEAVAKQLYRITKLGGVVVWVIGDATINGSETGTSFRQALRFMGLGFSCETMIYESNGTGAKGSINYYWQSFEYMFIFSKGKLKTSNLIRDKKNKWCESIITGERRKQNGQLKPTKQRKVLKYGIRTNIWIMGDGDKTDIGHPAIFPEALARDHIISWSNPGDLILDPFCGSGTTLKMAKELGRHYIGIDISQEYCRLSQRRVEGARVPLFVEQPQTEKEAEPEQASLF